MDWLLEAVARTPAASGPPTLTVLGPIPFTNLAYDDELNRDGSMNFSVRPEKLPGAVRDRFADLTVAPLEVVLRRGDRTLFAGPVWTWGLQGGTLAVNCRGLGGYLRYMQLDNVTGSLGWASLDQHLIAKALVDAWQALAYGNFGIDTSAIAPSGVTRQRTYLHVERHEIYQRLVELCEISGGFDWHVDPVTRALVLDHPTRGVDLSASVHLDLRNITSGDESASVAAGDVASEAFGVGSADPPATSQQANTTLRQTFGRVGVSETFDVAEQATLNGHVARLLGDRASMLRVPGPGLMPVRDADVGDFAPGDRISYVYDAGLGVVSRADRVARLQVQVDEGGGVEMAVEFGS